MIVVSQRAEKYTSQCASVHYDIFLNIINSHNHQIKLVDCEKFKKWQLPKSCIAKNIDQIMLHFSVSFDLDLPYTLKFKEKLLKIHCYE